MTAVTTTTTAPSTRPGLEHDTALDGLRGLAVAGVVAFHLGHLQGGFLGVDLFFTLSGYLITRLLLLERETTGRVALRAFWSRRAWRLLPVMYVLIAALAVYAATAARPDELAGIRGPGISSLLFVSNWWFIADGGGYWDLFAAPSPLEHVWSLSIEQQFYVVWPLLVVAVLRSRRGRSWLLAVTVVLAAASTTLLAVLAVVRPSITTTTLPHEVHSRRSRRFRPQADQYRHRSSPNHLRPSRRPYWCSGIPQP